MQPKFVLNVKTNTLHRYDGCHHSIAGACETKAQRGEVRLFYSIEEAVGFAGEFMKRCKLCFKNRGN